MQSEWVLEQVLYGLFARFSLSVESLATRDYYSSGDCWGYSTAYLHHSKAHPSFDKKTRTICVPRFVLYHFSGYMPIAVSQVGSYKSWLSHILYHYSGYIPIAVFQVGSYKSWLSHILYHYSGYIPIAVFQVGSYKSWLSHILCHYSGYIPIAVSQVGSYKSCRQATNRAVISCWPATLTLGSLQRLIKKCTPTSFFFVKRKQLHGEFAVSFYFWCRAFLGC